MSLYFYGKIAGVAAAVVENYWDAFRMSLEELRVFLGVNPWGISYYDWCFCAFPYGSVAIDHADSGEAYPR